MEKYPIQVYIAQDVTRHNQVRQALRKALDRSREQFTLSRRMSLARKPEAVLKALRCLPMNFALPKGQPWFSSITPKRAPGHGIELSAAWVSSPDKPAWLSETALYEEQQFWELVQPARPVVINGTRTNSHLNPLLRDFLIEGKIQSFILFPLVTSGVWLGCLAVLL